MSKDGDIFIEVVLRPSSKIDHELFVQVCDEVQKAVMDICHQHRIKLASIERELILKEV